MIRRFLIAFTFSTVLTIGGSVFGMSQYLKSVPYPIPPEDIERSYWIAGVVGLFGAGGGATGLLFAFLLTAEKSNKDRLKQYAQEQLKRSDLTPAESEAWTQIAGALLADHQPTKPGLSRLLRSIW